MSLADDVLARHVEAFCNLCKPTHSRGTCRVCFTEAWPCESVRLATQLRAAEQVVEASRELGRIFHARGKAPLQPFAETACIELVVRALAKYDKGAKEAQGR